MKERMCQREGCGQSIEGRRRTVKWCSHACGALARRARLKEREAQRAAALRAEGAGEAARCCDLPGCSAPVDLSLARYCGEMHSGEDAGRKLGAAIARVLRAGGKGEPEAGEAAAGEDRASAPEGEPTGGSHLEVVGVILTWEFEPVLFERLGRRRGQRGRPGEAKAALYRLLEALRAESCGRNAAYIQLYSEGEPFAELRADLESFGIPVHRFRSIYAFIVTQGHAQGRFLIGGRDTPPWLGASYMPPEVDEPELGPGPF